MKKCLFLLLVLAFSFTLTSCEDILEFGPKLTITMFHKQERQANARVTLYTHARDCDQEQNSYSSKSTNSNGEVSFSLQAGAQYFLRAKLSNGKTGACGSFTMSEDDFESQYVVY